MTAADEYRPAPEAIDAITRSVLEPLFVELESQLQRPLPTILTIQRRELLGPRILLARGHADASPAGEARLRVRRTGNPERSVFQVEAIYRGVACGTGFSGFSVRGELRTKDGGFEATRTTGWVVRYNVWEWQGWS